MGFSLIVRDNGCACYLAERPKTALLRMLLCKRGLKVMMALVLGVMPLGLDS